jgi:hypothetical protein
MLDLRKARCDGLTQEGQANYTQTIRERATRWQGDYSGQGG